MTPKILRAFLAILIVVGFTAAPAICQEKLSDDVLAQVLDTERAKNTLWKPLAAVGAGLVCIGGGFGIGRLAASAMEGTARQPEAGGQIRTTMIIAAALIEGFTFFALIVCIMSQY
jgi:F-type H+-transporting ATPase subunit c